MKLDVTQSALMGVLVARKNEIKEPHKLTCHGCGVNIFVSKPCLDHAIQSAKDRNHRLYYVCPACAEPFLQAVALGDGVMVGTPAAVDEIMPDMMRRRREFFQQN